MSEIFDRQPCDTNLSWLAFQQYCQMGIDRSIPKLRERLIEQASSENPRSKKIPSLQSLFTWSSKYRWQERVKAWDEEQDRLLAKELRDRHLAQYEVDLSSFYLQVRDQAKEQIEISGKLTQTILHWLEEFSNMEDLNWTIVAKLLVVTDSVMVSATDRLSACLSLNPETWERKQEGDR